MLNIKGKILDSNHKYKKLTQDGGKVLILEMTSLEQIIKLFLDFLAKEPIEILLKSYIIFKDANDGDTIQQVSNLYAAINNNIRTVGFTPMMTIPEDMEGVDLNKFNIAYKKVHSFLGN